MVARSSSATARLSRRSRTQPSSHVPTPLGIGVRTRHDRYSYGEGACHRPEARRPSVFALSDIRGRRRRVDAQARAAESARDAAEAARDAAASARKAAKRAARKASAAGAEGAAELAERIKPIAASAREAAAPKVELARDRIAPVVESAVDRVVPAVEAARERLTPAAMTARDAFLEEVLPKVAGAVAAAADKVADRANDVSARSQAIVEKPRRRRRRRRLVLVLGGFTAAGAAAAALLRRRGEAEQWTTYDPSAAPWAPTPESDEEAVSKDAADDAVGSSPAEAKADATEHPHQPTTPDAPAAETPLERDRSMATGGDRELGTVTDSAEKPAAKKAPAKKAAKKAPAKKAAAPRRPDEN